MFIKKTLSFLFTSSISFFSVYALDGTGSQNDPFQIGSVEELYEFTELVKKDINACAVLTDDITINEIELDSVGHSSGAFVPTTICPQLRHSHTLTSDFSNT